MHSNCCCGMPHGTWPCSQASTDHRNHSQRTGRGQGRDRSGSSCELPGAWPCRSQLTRSAPTGSAHRLPGSPAPCPRQQFTSQLARPQKGKRRHPHPACPPPPPGAQLPGVYVLDALVAASAAAVHQREQEPRQKSAGTAPNRGCPPSCGRPCLLLGRTAACPRIATPPCPPKKHPTQPHTRLQYPPACTPCPGARWCSNTHAHCSMCMCSLVTMHVSTASAPLPGQAGSKFIHSLAALPQPPRPVGLLLSCLIAAAWRPGERV